MRMLDFCFLYVAPPIEFFLSHSCGRTVKVFRVVQQAADPGGGAQDQQHGQGLAAPRTLCLSPNACKLVLGCFYQGQQRSGCIWHRGPGNGRQVHVRQEVRWQPAPSTVSSVTETI